MIELGWVLDITMEVAGAGLVTRCACVLSGGETGRARTGNGAGIALYKDFENFEEKSQWLAHREKL